MFITSKSLGGAYQQFLIFEKLEDALTYAKGYSNSSQVKPIKIVYELEDLSVLDIPVTDESQLEIYKKFTRCWLIEGDYVEERDV